MSLIANGAGEQPTGFYNGVVETSTRFEDGDDAYLHFTPGSAGNTKTWTISMWFKLGNPERGNLWTIGVNQSGIAGGMSLTAANLLEVNAYAGGTNNFFTTSRKFRDVSSWYHVVWHVDTTQGTQADRMNLYINGVKETSFANESYPAQDSVTKLNTAIAHWIGRYPESNYEFPYDGYIAEVNFIDGLALTPTSFGETKNGIWIAKDTSGLTFGNQGYRLQMKQSGVGTAGTSTVGADTSGNTNHWTSVNLVASDCAMPDNPENNFPTMNPLDVGGSITYSEGNLKMVVSGGSMEGSRATMALPQSGKWYWEVGVASLGYISQVGIATAEKKLANTADGAADHIAWGFGGWMASNNSSVSKYQVNVGGSGGDNWVAQPASGDVLGIAYDADNGKLWFAKNGTYQNTSGTANPATGADPRASSLTGKEWFPLYAGYPENSPNYIMNFGQDSAFAGTETAQGNTDGNGIGDFYYAPPSGFLALCSANLPEPTIGPNSGANNQSDDHFNTVLYTGNGADDRSISGVGFQPDWVWLKSRSTTADHEIYDSSRGATKRLSPRIQNAESTEANNLQAFESDGFQLGSDTDINENNTTYVSWNWKANGGTTSTLTAGTIDATVQANVDAGFSIITFVSNQQASQTIAHGLGVAPDMFFQKSRDESNYYYWYVRPTGAGAFLAWADGNGGKAAKEDSTGTFGNTHPTDTLLTVGLANTSHDSGHNMLTYCFASKEGFSKVGSYIGNGNVNGAFVFTGFRPAWVMFKKTSAADDWVIIDSTRDIDNVASQTIYANLTAAEDSNVTNRSVDFLSNGFKLRSSGTYINLNGGTFIYLAFAEAPFKYANAR